MWAVLLCAFCTIPGKRINLNLTGPNLKEGSGQVPTAGHVSGCQLSPSQSATNKCFKRRFLSCVCGCESPLWEAASLKRSRGSLSSLILPEARTEVNKLFWNKQTKKKPLELKMWRFPASLKGLFFNWSVERLFKSACAVFGELKPSQVDYISRLQLCVLSGKEVRGKHEELLHATTAGHEELKSDRVSLSSPAVPLVGLWQRFARNGRQVELAKCLRRRSSGHELQQGW